MPANGNGPNLAASHLLPPRASAPVCMPNDMPAMTSPSLALAWPCPGLKPLAWPIYLTLALTDQKLRSPSAAAG
jgi:hypothetical protein